MSDVSRPVPDDAATPAPPRDGDEGEQTPSSDEYGPTRRSAPKPVNRRGWLIGGIIALVVLLVVVGLLIWKITTEEAPEPVEPAAVTVTNPVPTPAVTPIQKDPGSPFYDLLPDSALQFALTESEPDESRGVAQALEAFTLTYGDGADEMVSVETSQWASAKAANKRRNALEKQARKADEGAEATEGPVEHSDAEVGSFTILVGTEQGVAVWTNGTAVFRAAGPADQIEDFYKAFSL